MKIYMQAYPLSSLGRKEVTMSLSLVHLMAGNTRLSLSKGKKKDENLNLEH